MIRMWLIRASKRMNKPPRTQRKYTPWLCLPWRTWRPWRFKKLGALSLSLLLAGTSIRADEFEPARTHAVLIGVLEWENGLPGFPKTNRKDRELRNVLISRGVPAENITLLLDAEATLANIRAALTNAVANAESGSTLVIYYAGHGWPTGGGDYCLANYDVQNEGPPNAWSLNGLGAMLTRDFRGKQVFLWADCCYSGGLQLVVDALAKRRIAAFSLTSAGMANTSTRNWTFTQSLIDALRGEPIVDDNNDGKITLLEMRDEVQDAMQHLEGQAHGYAAHAIADDYVMAKSGSARPPGGSAALPIGTYVVASDRGQRRFGRVVAGDNDHLSVQFYDYTEKRSTEFDADRVARSTRAVRPPTLLDAGVKPDCLTEWHGAWYPATVLKQSMKDGRPTYQIHYLGYDASWDEWVGSERVRLLKKQAPREDATIR